ncbi:hypothetical protein PV325_011604 [Microctonus aethiopoides]|uniref:Uncharacterized protein n=1 Tax=Microctonus aethiopoides TaxID=144406 RepID=A0AA39F8K0_9HYME|nr:hypothetical protein PV325_011604 [Microctonus aethiopoides]KAK0095702.1 hypothetical protein PV326_007629 [Microctonus aethiopoides]KAK0164940.1 hypothetical protein PV328_003504 [Microctonus aethiopoides]
MYRLTIALLVLCAMSICISAHHGPPPHIKAAVKKCNEEAGGDESTMEKIRNFEEIDDPKFKCFHACIMKAAGSMNEDGTINEEKSIEDIPQDMPDREKMIEAIKACKDEKGADECETAEKIAKCFMGNMPPRKHPE